MTQEEQKKLNAALDYQERQAEIQRHLFGKGRSWKIEQTEKQTQNKWSRR